jgi:hypothetical protein
MLRVNVAAEKIAAVDTGTEHDTASKVFTGAWTEVVFFSNFQL